MSKCTDTSKHSKAILKYCIMHCMWGLSAAMISSLQNIIHPTETEINPLKMACGKVYFIFIFRTVTYTILSCDGVWNVCNFQCTIAFTGWPPGEHYNNNMDPCKLWF